MEALHVHDMQYKIDHYIVMMLLRNYSHQKPGTKYWGVYSQVVKGIIMHIVHSDDPYYWVRYIAKREKMAKMLHHGYQ